MSGETRFRMIEQEYAVDVCNGGSCTNEKPQNEVRDGWIAIRQPYKFDNWDFCSMRCLAEWAARQAEKAEEVAASAG